MDTICYDDVWYNLNLSGLIGSFLDISATSGGTILSME